MQPSTLKTLHPKVASDTDAATGPPQDPKEEGLDKLAEVHTRVLDTLAGFDKLHEKAEPEFRQVALAFQQMHAEHERDLSAALVAAGRSPEQDGSFFGGINRAVIEVRSWFEDVTAKVMDQIKEGEKHVLDAYADAQAASQSVEVNAMLARHVQDIDAKMRKYGN